MSEIKKVIRKSMKIRPSGRSTDFITPSFGHGCLYSCTYCYMKRHKPEGLNVATNTEDILQAIKKHLYQQQWPKIPNQTHSTYWTYDLSCNEDFILHLKFHDWQTIFDWFVNEPRAFGSMATKYCNGNLLNYNPYGKIRVRMSLMPEEYRQVLEPNTSSIEDRIAFIPLLIQSGYDVHINYSPVIITPGAKELYKELFEQVKQGVEEKYRHIVKAEVIFLTHNEKKHQYNLDNSLPGEELLWNPDIQEYKISQYGGKNIRYKHKLKRVLIKEFKELHKSIIPWNSIRYIF